MLVPWKTLLAFAEKPRPKPPASPARKAWVTSEPSRETTRPRTPVFPPKARKPLTRSEEHTSELQSLMRNSYDVFCLKKNKITFIVRQKKHLRQPYTLTDETDHNNDTAKTSHTT